MNNLLKNSVLLSTISALFFVLCSLFIFAPSARAQSLSLSISPPVIELIIKPGVSVTQRFTVVNNGDSVIVTPQLTGYINGSPESPSDYVPEPWISILNSDFVWDKPTLLKPGEKRQIVIRFNPDETVPETDYNRVFLLTTTPPPSGESTKSSFSSSIGSILLITVSENGVLPKELKITQFQVPQILDSFDPLEVRVRVANTGKTLIHTIGQITLSGSIGKASYSLLPQTLLIGENRSLLTDFQVASSQNGNNSTLSLPGFYLGKYTVTLNLLADEGEQKIIQNQTVYAFPWKAGLVCLIILTVVWGFYPRKKKIRIVKKT